MRKIFLFLTLTIITSFICYSKEFEAEKIPTYFKSNSSFIIGLGKDNMLSYYTIDSMGRLMEVKSDFVNNTMSSLLDQAKNTTCNLKIKPSQISISVGIISATWETEKLCK